MPLCNHEISHSTQNSAENKAKFKLEINCCQNSEFELQWINWPTVQDITTAIIQQLSQCGKINMGLDLSEDKTFATCYQQSVLEKPISQAVVLNSFQWILKVFETFTMREWCSLLNSNSTLHLSLKSFLLKYFYSFFFCIVFIYLMPMFNLKMHVQAYTWYFPPSLTADEQSAKK